MQNFEHHLIPDAGSFSYALEVQGFEETMSLGEKVAGLLKGGEIILLSFSYMVDLVLAKLVL